MNRKIKHIIVGAGRVLDFPGSYTRNAYTACFAARRFTPQRSDFDALSLDMLAVGGDFSRAMEAVVNEKVKEKQR